MARTPVLAAGGIVLRRQATPLIAVVRLRKRNEWVLPKGKLDDGETPRAAAEREVLEETGHEVSVHEFLGTLVYDSGGRYKVVHYWRMEAGDEPAYELMYDIKAVDWLPLEDALERLSRDHERAFLENVGPIALNAAVLGGATRRKAAKPAMRRPRRAVTPPPSVNEPTTVPSEPAQLDAPIAQEEPLTTGNEAVEAPVSASVTESEIPPPFAPEIEPVVIDAVPMQPPHAPRRNLIQRVRDWLRRAA
ncbi:NUDIX hydrolase [Bradyrhizobium cenepequi]|uniref:NUDIX hydrolase n=1 Tax=Bradyrhizobium cenepequi TaxID=2821403 RepID=UPI001CE2BC1B|nr:NUDIX hydrolase [Bradyrhizobium cenepequi]MCA6106603.1 NUDIX domain-containing protein [Bradyrhizobium cenepequi]